MTGTAHIFLHLYRFENEQAQNWRQYNEKTNKIMKLLCKLLLEILVPLLMAISIVGFSILTMIAYFKPGSNYSPLMSIISVIMSQITSDQNVAGIGLFATLFGGVSLSLIHGFTKINNKIKICTRSENPNGSGYNLMDLIEEHKNVTKKTTDYNKLFRILLFGLYYISIPSTLLCIYGIHHKDMDTMGRIYSSSITLLCSIILIVVGYLCCKIIITAKLPYPHLMGYMCKKQSRMPVRNRMKVMAFIERLSGPDIGFYCYDLFPMNYWESYQLIAISVTNYLLLISII